jgi:DNA-binding NarL/FixJ family response regulator
VAASHWVADVMTSLIRILIVDDDVATRTGVATILSSDPDIAIVGQTDNGSDALAIAAQLSPDVMVVNAQLPGMDGIELTRRITVDDAGTRVIVLTTFASQDLLFRSMQAGASGFMLKRATADELIRAVHVVAQGNDLPMPEATLGLIASFITATTEQIRLFNPPLTAREAELLILVARGLSNQQISSSLYVSLETVRTHLKHVYMKCGARDRAQAVIAAYESGMVRPPDVPLERFPTRHHEVTRRD